jgi:hypothetical protein
LLLPSLSLLFLCYNPLFSLPNTLSAHSHPITHPMFNSPSYPSPICQHTTSPTHSPPTDWPTVPTVHNPSHLQSLTQHPLLQQ